ncbi:MAG: ATP-dependent DNA helicase [Candidatus Limnocylindrales bacterium]
MPEVEARRAGPGLGRATAAPRAPAEPGRHAPTAAPRTPAESNRDWLTQEQRAAVEWGDGPLMVLAGAGTGKTTVVVERVRYLLDRDPELAPENVLVLTYNVRAAAELAHRIERAIGLERAARLWVHNFHSFGNRLLAAHRAELGLTDGGHVLDEVGQQLLLFELRPQMSNFVYHDVSLNPGPVLRGFADMIGRAKDELVTPAEYAAFVENKRHAFESKFGALESAVEAIRARRAANDLGPIKEVRAEIHHSDEAGEKRADRVARRQASGTGYAVGWNHLTPDQQETAAELKATYLRDAAAFEVLRLTEEAQVYALYQRTLHERGLVDFGEQQIRAIELLTDRPNLLLRYQRQFRHVLVDEFQDANMAQVLLLELVGRGPDKPDNVVVVGDDDQSIYRFRGASYAAFAQFKDRFSEPPAWAPERGRAEVSSLPLLENRRSSANILAAANTLIEHNRARLKSGQPLRPIRDEGAPVEIVYARDEAHEADVVVDRLRSAFETLPARLPNRDGTDRPKRWSDLAVLYRRHRHREAIAEHLRRADIPYTLIGGVGLFAQPEIRDLEAALRVCANPNDSVAFARLLTAGPWRFDAPEILRLTSDAAWDRRPVFEAATAAHRAAEVTAGARGAPGAHAAADAQAAPEPSRGEPVQPPLPATPALRAKLDMLFGCIEDLVPRGPRDGPFTILQEYLVRTKLLADLLAIGTPEAQRTLLSVARLMRFTADWQREHPSASLLDFVHYLDLFEEAGGDLEADRARDVEADGVQLMTVYQAKGLEYEVVVVPRLVEGQFPDTREENLLIPIELLRQHPPDEFAIAEERRLCFVAMTRARSRLLLTALDSPAARAQPSRFAGEIAEDGAVVVERREGSSGSAPGEGDQEGLTATDVAVATTPSLERLMPVPEAFERRYALRRRAVELIGALEAGGGADPEAAAALTAELVTVARDAAGLADEDRQAGLDPVTLRVVSRHSPAGSSLLEVASLPPSFSHSQFRAYAECPLAYAFANVYRIPTEERKGFFEFGTAIHAAFETYTTARRDARAAGLPDPGFETLQAGFAKAFEPTAFPDAEAAKHYLSRSGPTLQRFYERELVSASEALLFEAHFVFELDPGDAGEPIQVKGFIDRIDRLPDGSIEVTDYKTGGTKSQRDVDEDEQLSTYALALRAGAIPDPATGERLPAPSRLTLYFAESDLALSTARTDEQLDAFRDHLVAVAGRIRSGDFAATPEYRRCSWCDWRRLCPSRWGEA